MDASLSRGMVLAFSIWDDASGHMAWLDQAPNGPCGSDTGIPD